MRQQEKTPRSLERLRKGKGAKSWSRTAEADPGSPPAQIVPFPPRLCVAPGDGDVLGFRGKRQVKLGVGGGDTSPAEPGALVLNNVHLCGFHAAFLVDGS